MLQLGNQSSEGGACLLTAVRDSLRKSGCNGGGQKASRLVRNPLIGHLLEQRLEFVPSPGNWDARVLDKLKLLGATILTTAPVAAHHQVLLNGNNVSVASEAKLESAQQPQQSRPVSAVVKQPAQFSFSDVQLDRSYTGQPYGFVNEGNYCYMISVLQALLHTAPFANFACQHRAASTCRQSLLQPAQRSHFNNQQRHHQQNFGGRWCAICEFGAYAQRATGGGPAYPRAFMARVTTVSPTLRSNRQEDAHEFLRCLLDYMEGNCGGSRGRGGPKLASNAIRVLFGGRLKSSVVCTRCGTESRTFEDFMDLSLCIQFSSSLADCLRKFVSPDLLKDSNAYKCDKCRAKVTAKKSFSIASGPPILTVQLNRFQWGHSNKISKFVQFPLSIDIRPYMSKPGRPVLYELYAVVIHQGSSTKFGHYYCYARRGRDWWSLNDSCVDRITESRVLQSCPYILLYKRTDLSPLIGPNAESAASSPAKLPASSVVEPASANSTGKSTFSALAKFVAKHHLSPVDTAVGTTVESSQTGFHRQPLKSAHTVAASTVGQNGEKAKEAAHAALTTSKVNPTTANLQSTVPKANEVQKSVNPNILHAPSVATEIGGHKKAKSELSHSSAVATAMEIKKNANSKFFHSSSVATATEVNENAKSKLSPSPAVTMATKSVAPSSQSRSRPNKELRQLMSARPMRPEPLPWSVAVPQLPELSPESPDHLRLPNGESASKKRKANGSLSSEGSSQIYDATDKQPLIRQPAAEPGDEACSSGDAKRRRKEAKLVRRKLRLLKLLKQRGGSDTDRLVNGMYSAQCNGHAD